MDCLFEHHNHQIHQQWPNQRHQFVSICTPMTDRSIREANLRIVIIIFIEFNTSPANVQQRVSSLIIIKVYIRPDLRTHSVIASLSLSYLFPQLQQKYDYSEGGDSLYRVGLMF